MLKLKLFFHMLKLDMRENPAHWHARLLFLLGPFLSYAAVEILNGNSPFALQLWRMLWNFVWYFVLYGLAWLITGRRKRAGAITAAAGSFLFGLINHYVLRFRGTMFFPIDILSWRTAANVSAGYDYTPDREIVIALAITAVYILIWLVAFRKNLRRSEKPSRSFTAVASGALATFLLVFFSAGFLPSINLYAEQWLTQRNGFVFNFMLSLRHSFLQEPEGYSLELVEDIQEDALAESEEAPAVAPTQPENILLIMNESLADLSIYENYAVSRDPLEFMRSMEENTVSGWICSPVIGGGTANVEYEALTLNPAHFFPNGTVAYQMYVDTETPSLASLAGEQGYESYAFHPYLASGWNRVQAYEHLGFDHQIYDEDVTEPEYVRDYISDQCDFELLQEITEENEGKTFIFNVTMQNHSGYQLPWTNLSDSVALTGDLAGISSSARQYLCLVDETDRAFEDMIAYYENSEEPTLIAMFGDHQPPLSNEFFDRLMGSTDEERTAEENLQKYITPFVIWANYDIPEEEDIFISSNYFGLLVSDIAGLERSDYMDMVAQVMEEIPVIHDLGYVTAEGEFVDDFDELSTEQQTMLSEYEILAYHNQFDREEDDAFYELQPEDGSE